MHNQLAPLFARSTPLEVKEDSELVPGGGDATASCEANGSRWRATQAVLGAGVSERDIGPSLRHAGRPNRLFQQNNSESATSVSEHLFKEK